MGTTKNAIILYEKIGYAVCKTCCQYLLILECCLIWFERGSLCSVVLCVSYGGRVVTLFTGSVTMRNDVGLA